MSPTRTTIVGFALLSLLTTPAAARQAFEGSITYRITSDGRGTDATFMSKGTRTRMEMQMPEMPGAVVMLMDNETMVMQMIMASMGMYMEMDMKRMAESAPPSGAADAPTMEKLGTSDEIAGIRCENYRFKSGSEPETEACIATGMGYFMGGMQSPMPGRNRGSQGPDWAAFAKEFKDGMLPLRARILRNGNWTTILEAVSVTRKSLEDSLFRLPAGLRKMSMPGGE